MRRFLFFVILFVNAALGFAAPKAVALYSADETKNYSFIRFVEKASEADKINDKDFSESSAEVIFAANASGVSENASLISILDNVVMPEINSGDVRLAKVLVQGTSSPEGSYHKNLILANERAKSLRDYISKKLNRESATEYEVKCVSADYNYLCELMKQANDPDYARVQKLVSYYFALKVQPSNGKSIEQLRVEQLRANLKTINNGVLWARLSRSYFPMLRSARVIFVFEKVRNGDKKNPVDFGADKPVVSHSGKSGASQGKSNLSVGRTGKSKTKLGSSSVVQSMVKSKPGKQEEVLAPHEPTNGNVSPNNISQNRSSKDSVPKSGSDKVGNQQSLEAQTQEAHQLYEKRQDDMRTHAYLTAAIIVSSIFAVLLICFITYYIYRQRKNRQVLEQLRSVLAESKSNVQEKKEEKAVDVQVEDKFDQVVEKETEEIKEVSSEEPTHNDIENPDENTEVPVVVETGETPENNEEKNVEISTKNDEAASLLYDRIMNVMKEQKPYLDPSFNVQGLADVLFSNRSYVSKAINHISGKNFYAWLADYRNEIIIQELNANPNLSLNTLLELTGHNSKEAFSRQFKQLNGKTFSEYKKQLQDNSSAVLKINFQD